MATTTKTNGNDTRKGSFLSAFKPNSAKTSVTVKIDENTADKVVLLGLPGGTTWEDVRALASASKVDFPASLSRKYIPEGSDKKASITDKAHGERALMALDCIGIV